MAARPEVRQGVRPQLRPAERQAVRTWLLTRLSIVVLSVAGSWMSSSRHGLPLMAYSEPPERNIVRLIVTSA